MILRSLPELYRRHIRVDVAFVPVSRPDENGFCGLGISNYAWRTIFEQARTVIFEINERLPRLQGVDGSHRVHLSEADYIVEGEHEPFLSVLTGIRPPLTSRSQSAWWRRFLTGPFSPLA